MSKFGRLFDRFRPAAAESKEAPTEFQAGRWVVAGLGNPGEQYHRSRHNLGFMAARRLATRHGVELNRRKFNGLYAETPIAGAPAIIVMPQTFYNRSGDCLVSLLGYFKVPVAQLIVIHDEMDLPLQTIRIKRGGSDAGNRGVRSVAGALGTPDFIRIRIGVSHPGEPGQAIEHVLKPLTTEELRQLDGVLDRVADAVASLIADGLERAMSLYNQRRR
jgi:PTH1 family peptidyl-tRNA hydrolase